jgi:hypothetical protein
MDSAQNSGRAVQYHIDAVARGKRIGLVLRGGNPGVARRKHSSLDRGGVKTIELPLAFAMDICAFRPGNCFPKYAARLWMIFNHEEHKSF